MSRIWLSSWLTFNIKASAKVLKVIKLLLFRLNDLRGKEQRRHVSPQGPHVPRVGAPPLSWLLRAGSSPTRPGRSGLAPLCPPTHGQGLSCSQTTPTARPTTSPPSRAHRPLDMSPGVATGSAQPLADPELDPKCPDYQTHRWAASIIVTPLSSDPRAAPQGPAASQVLLQGLQGPWPGPPTSNPNSPQRGLLRHSRPSCPTEPVLPSLPPHLPLPLPPPGTSDSWLLVEPRTAVGARFSFSFFFLFLHFH